MRPHSFQTGGHAFLVALAEKGLTPFHQPAQAALVAGLQQCEMSPPGEEGHSGRDTPEVAKICT